jgi:hypothetical protein
LAELARLDPLALTRALSGDEPARCADCKRELSGANARYGTRCDDCYYDALSEVLEQPPPGLPGMRR